MWTDEELAALKAAWPGDWVDAIDGTGYHKRLKGTLVMARVEASGSRYFLLDDCSRCGGTWEAARDMMLLAVSFKIIGCERQLSTLKDVQKSFPGGGK